jgi:hypothetical protein
MIVTLGNGGYIFARSSKLKLTTASATEIEHYCLCEAAMYNIWLRDMLRNLRVKLENPTTMGHVYTTEIISIVQKHKNNILTYDDLWKS